MNTMKKIARMMMTMVLLLSIACTSLFVTAPGAEAASYTSATITRAQECLNKLGYTVPYVNGKLDNKTREQLKAFQRDANLIRTGEPDKQTMYKLEKRSKAAQNNNNNAYAKLQFNGNYRLLENGSRGPRVKILNEMLTVLGYHPDKGSVFGNKTESAVRAFQKDFVKEQPVDGMAGPYTLSRLEVAYGAVANGSYTPASLKKYVQKNNKMPN